MTDRGLNVERRIRVAAFLVWGGLAVAGGTLFWEHPISFLVFLLGGGLLVAAGIVWYLLTLLARG